MIKIIAIPVDWGYNKIINKFSIFVPEFMESASKNLKE